MSDKTKTPPTRFREMLKLYREKHGLSYRELAVLTGLDHNLIWRFEEGRPVQEHAFSALIAWILGEHNPDKDQKALGEVTK
jgi:transcriptional regulator with XRE-family HTH domain